MRVTSATRRHRRDNRNKSSKFIGHFPPGQLHARKQVFVKCGGWGDLSGCGGFSARMVRRSSHPPATRPTQTATSLPNILAWASFPFPGFVAAMSGGWRICLPRRLVSIQVTSPQTPAGGKPVQPGRGKKGPYGLALYQAATERFCETRLRLSIPVPVWWRQNRLRKRPRGPPGGRAVWRTRPVCPA